MFLLIHVCGRSSRVHLEERRYLTSWWKVCPCCHHGSGWGTLVVPLLSLQTVHGDVLLCTVLFCEAREICLSEFSLHLLHATVESISGPVNSGTSSDPFTRFSALSGSVNQYASN